MLNLKTIKKYANDSGYSERAIRHKIYEEVWGEGIVYKAPDGRILISVTGVENWVLGIENTKVSSKSATQPLDCPLPTLADAGESLRKFREEMTA